MQCAETACCHCCNGRKTMATLTTTRALQMLIACCKKKRGGEKKRKRKVKKKSKVYVESKRKSCKSGARATHDFKSPQMRLPGCLPGSKCKRDRQTHLMMQKMPKQPEKPEKPQKCRTKLQLRLLSQCRRFLDTVHVTEQKLLSMRAFAG